MMSHTFRCCSSIVKVLHQDLKAVSGADQHIMLLLQGHPALLMCPIHRMIHAACWCQMYSQHWGCSKTWTPKSGRSSTHVFCCSPWLACGCWCTLPWGIRHLGSSSKHCWKCGWHPCLDRRKCLNPWPYLTTQVFRHDVAWELLTYLSGSNEVLQSTSCWIKHSAAAQNCWAEVWRSQL